MCSSAIVRQLSKVDRDRIARLLVMLTVSSALRMWREHLGSAVDEAADPVARVLRSSAAAAAPRNGR